MELAARVRAQVELRGESVASPPQRSTNYSPPPPAAQALPPSPPAPAGPAVRPIQPANETPFITNNWSRPQMAAAQVVNRVDVSGPPPVIAPEPMAAPTIPAPAPVDSGPRPIASSEEYSHRDSSVPSYAANPPANGILPAASSTPRPLSSVKGIMFVNQTHLALDYKISRLGSSGIGAVELWRTQDDGRTWQLFAKDEDLKPPFEIDLPSEGYYGFRLLIRSKAGLGKQSPQPGEQPEVRIEVDTTKPKAQLWTPKASADPRKRDTLTLVWTAEDRNLSAKPVTLKWSDSRGGQWKTIVADHPNSGSYDWKMPPELPYQVYLRLEVADLAGNVGAAETTDPVLVDLTEPEGHLEGIFVPGAKQP